MTIYQYGEQAAENVLIQLVGEHDLPTVEDEVREIQKMTERPFSLIAAKVDTWNQELTPWKAPAVYGTEEFGDGAAQTLEEIKKLCVDKSKTYYIGGYSLAGLFSLWAAYQTDLFAGVAATSPSVWFPGFIPYMKEHEIRAEKVYLSLGGEGRKDQKSCYGAGGSLYPDRLCTSAGERAFLYAGMESGRTFQRSCFTNGKGVCMADEINMVMGLWK